MNYIIEDLCDNLKNLSFLTKFKLSLNFISNIVCLIGIFYYKNYNNVLRDIENKYDNWFAKSIHVSSEQYFDDHLFWGSMALIILFFSLFYVIKKSDDLDIIFKIIISLLNIIIAFSLFSEMLQPSLLIVVSLAIIFFLVVSALGCLD